MTRYTDEEILSHLSDFYHKNGRSPTKHEFSKANGYISGWVVVDRFGSWNVGLEKAGIPKNTRQVKNNTWCRNSIMNYTKEYIKKLLCDRVSEMKK